MNNFTNKAVLVTGASRGLGLTIAETFRSAGANVVMTDVVFEQSGAKKNPKPDDSGRIMTMKMDVTREEEIEHVIRQTELQFGGTDILVNNAAVIDQFALVENQSLDAWQKALDVNQSGAFRCIKAVWKQMCRNNWGRVINISSFTSESGSFGQPGYGSTKAGLMGLTRALALEGAKYQVTVNVVLPGFINTESLHRLQPEIQERIKKRIAMKRFTEPQETADVVTFLASGSASYITGASIPVTGGADLFVF